MAMSDTSSNTIQVPSEFVTPLNRAIRAKHLMFGYYQVDCATIMKLPQVTFIINGVKFTLRGEHYTQKISLDSFTMCLSLFRATTGDVPKGVWVVGGAFLAQYYTIYDIDKKSIGFVRAY